MTITATSALAPEFAHAGGTVATFTFASGTSPVAVTLAAGTHRMWLAPSASCHLRLLAAAIAAQLSAARSPTVYTCVASVSAAGVFSLRIVSAGALPTAVTFTAPSWRRLGYASATPTITTSSGYVDIAGTRPLWYLALFASLAGYAPQPQQSGGAETDGAGRTYTFAGAATWWRTFNANGNARDVATDAAGNTSALSDAVAFESAAADQPLMQRAGLAAADLATALCRVQGAPLLIFAGPGIRRGRRIRQAVSQLDLLPTLRDLSPDSRGDAAPRVDCDGC